MSGSVGSTASLASPVSLAGASDEKANTLPVIAVQNDQSSLLGPRPTFSKPGSFLDPLLFSPGPDKVSLFPTMDRAMRILPMHLTTDRSDRCNYVFICIILSFMLLNFLLTSLTSFMFVRNEKKDDHFSNVMIVTWVLTGALPYTSALSRVYFFWYYGESLTSIWNVPKQSLPESLKHGSYLWRSTSKMKLDTKNRVNGWIKFMIVLWGFVLINTLVLGLIAYKDFNKLRSSTRGLPGLYEIWQVTYFLSHWFLEWPDLIMYVVAHLVLVECHLSVESFDQKLSRLTLVELCQREIIDDYRDLVDKLDMCFKSLWCWNVCLFGSLILQSWWLVTLITDFCKYLIKPDSHTLVENNSPSYVLIVIGYRSIMLAGSFAVAYFELGPAIQIDRTFKGLMERVNKKQMQLIHDIGHSMVDEDGSTRQGTVSQSGYCAPISAGSLGLKLKSSKQNHSTVAKDTELLLLDGLSHWQQYHSAVSVLQKLLHLMTDEPCVYEIIGVTVNWDNITGLFITLCVGKVISYLWEPFGGF